VEPTLHANAERLYPSFEMIDSSTGRFRIRVSARGEGVFGRSHEKCALLAICDHRTVIV